MPSAILDLTFEEGADVVLEWGVDPELEKVAGAIRGVSARGDGVNGPAPIDSDVDANLEELLTDTEEEDALEDAPPVSGGDADLEESSYDSEDDAPFLHVRSSNWFDLGDVNGRLQVTRHVIGLEKWANAEITKEAATL